MNHAVRYEPDPIMRWIWSALMPFLLVSIKYRTLNHTSKSIVRILEDVPTVTEKR